MYMPPDGPLPKAQNVFQEEQKVEREGGVRQKLERKEYRLIRSKHII